MRFIPTRFHGLIDYIVGVALIAAPWLFNFVPEGGYAAWGNETMTPIVVGAIIILQSILITIKHRIYTLIPNFC